MCCGACGVARVVRGACGVVVRNVACAHSGCFVLCEELRTCYAGTPCIVTEMKDFKFSEISLDSDFCSLIIILKSSISQFHSIFCYPTILILNFPPSLE